MYILSQDENVIFQAGTVLFDEHKENGKFMGFNIYGVAFTGRVLLGNYDEEEDTEQIIKEIFTAIKRGDKVYTMPKAFLQPGELDRYSGGDI